jgi:uncharacterized protein (DUF697 family)
MQNKECRCGRCQSAAKAELELLEFPGYGPFEEAEEIGLAMELLAVASEEELDQFLGKMFKKVGRFVGKVARPLGGVLKGLAKKALPFVGSALGSFIPIPGVGTAIGGALGGALANALEMETAGLEGEERELEMARRFVRIAGSAAQQAALAGAGDDPQRAAQQAVSEAVRAHLPGIGALAPRATGSWRRQPCGSIVIEL